MSDVLKHDNLRILAANGVVREVTIQGVEDGFSVLIRTVSGVKILHTKIDKPRIFKKLETLLGYLKDQGIEQANLNFAGWTGPKAHTA